MSSSSDKTPAAVWGSDTDDPLPRGAPDVTSMVSNELLRAVTEHYPRLVAKAKLAMQGASDAQDLVHTAIERVLAKEQKYRDHPNIGALLNRVLRNLIVDWHRWGQKLDRSVDIDLLSGEEPSCTTRTSDRFDLSDVQDALTKIPTPYREVFELFQFGKCSYVDISRRLDIHPKTVGSRMFRAKRQLRALLLAKEEEMGGPDV